jgi:hypothetical protein
MACWGPNAPDSRNYAQEMANTVGAQTKQMPRILAAEQKYQPQFTDLQLGTMNQFLNGRNGNPGFLDMYAGMIPQLQGAQNEANTLQRGADVADIQKYGADASAAILGANPYNKSLLDQLNAQANQGLALGSQVDPETMQMIKNQIMGQRSSMGWGLNPGDMAQVAMSTGQAGQALRQQRQQFGLNTLAANQSVLGDPFMQILGRSSGTTGLAGSLFGAAQGSGQNIGPTLFNPESAYAGNLAAWNQAYDWQYKQATPSTMGKIGMVSDTVGSFIGSVAKGFACWVAREVYGEWNPKWLIFRNWLLTEAPAWLREWYLENGEATAEWLKLHPWAKGPVRWLMNLVVEPKIRKAANHA